MPDLEPLRRAPRPRFARPSWAKPDLNGSLYAITISETAASSLRGALARGEVTDAAALKLLDAAREPLPLRRYVLVRACVGRLDHAVAVPPPPPMPPSMPPPGPPPPRRLAVKRRGSSAGPTTHRRRRRRLDGLSGEA